MAVFFCCRREFRDGMDEAAELSTGKEKIVI